MPWSDWQDPALLDFNVGYRSMELAQRELDSATVPGGDSAALMLATQTSLQTGGGTFIGAAGPGTGGTASALLDASAVGASGEAQARGVLGYNAVTLLGSALAGELGIPAELPDEAVSIPFDERGPYTVSGIVDFESNDTTFQGWQDTTFQVLQVVVIFYDVDLDHATIGSAWTPPTSLDFVVGTLPAVTDGALINTPLQLYVGPDLTYGDLTITDTFTMSSVATGPNAPYTGPTAGVTGDPEITDEQFDVPVTLSGVTDQDISIVLMSSYAGPDTFAVPTFTHDNMYAEIRLLGNATSFPMTSLLSPLVTYLSPRWRYWIEDQRLRTIGDHFRSVGGADIKSLIPGVGWVKVRRGT